MKQFMVGACAVAFCTLPSRARRRRLPRTCARFRCNSSCAERARAKRASPIAAPGSRRPARSPPTRRATSRPSPRPGTSAAPRWSLDSDGGSVLGALALGRAMRKLGMTTTVGKTVELPRRTASGARSSRRNAYCESMCAFVLLAGVERHVPAEARVMVHQIWLGDRRDDPTAANYSAEDLVVVQRDIGRLAQYTMEMGGGDRPARDRAEDPAVGADAAVVARGTARHEDRHRRHHAGGQFRRGAGSLPLSNGIRATIQERSWAMLANAGRLQIGRTHPLTVEGEDIGRFDLSFACGDPGSDIAVTYFEQRRGGRQSRRCSPRSNCRLPASRCRSRWCRRSPERGRRSSTRSRRGRVPVELFKSFADPRSRSLLIETSSEDRRPRSGSATPASRGASRSSQRIAARSRRCATRSAPSCAARLKRSRARISL